MRMNLRCWFGFHDFEWSKPHIEFEHIFFLLCCKRCEEKRMLDKFPFRGFTILPLKLQRILTEDEFCEWQKRIDPEFMVSGEKR